VAASNTFIFGYTQGVGIYKDIPRDVAGNMTQIGTSRTTANFTEDNSASACSELSFPLKAPTSYAFTYNLIYSTAGLLAGMELAMQYTGTLVSIGYCVQMCDINNNVKCDGATAVLSYIGTTASLGGGGPKMAIVAGALVTGGTTGGDLQLMMRSVGLSATATILPNSTVLIHET
jgi:hypothetical protein